MPSLAKNQKTIPPQQKTLQLDQPKPKKIDTTYNGLRKAIDKLDINTIRQIIDTNPKLLIKPKLSQNPIKYSALTGKSQIVQALLKISYDKYRNLITPNCNFINDAFIQCIRFQKFDMVKLFIQAGFNLNTVIFKGKGLVMNSIDFAIVGGHYQIAYFIYARLNPQMKNIRNIQQFEIIGKKYLYRYVNYPMVIQGLKNNIHPDNIGNYLKQQLSPKKKQQKKRMYEEGCWQWFMRILGCNEKKKLDTPTKSISNSANIKYPHHDTLQSVQSSHKHLQQTSRPLNSSKLTSTQQQ